jgi:hypothetical protein
MDELKLMLYFVKRFNVIFLMIKFATFVFLPEKRHNTLVKI